MEGQAPKAKQLEDSLNQEFRLMLEKNGKVDQITAHCKLDHMTPHHSRIPQLKKNQSCYLSSYSPSKAHPNYNSSPQAEKKLHHFRKYDTNEFTLPAIINDSQYHSSYLGKKTQTTVKCQQKPSFFMKLNWALNPISEYENKYLCKDGNKFNKDNKQRVNYNTIEVIDTHEGNQRISKYKYDYKAIVIVMSKEPVLSIKNKDHLFGKENKELKTGISEYKRRYDSVVDGVKQQKQSVSLYRKDSVVKRAKPSAI